MTGSNGAKRPIRIAAFSGAVGDYAGALAAAVHGGPADVLIGDYLAEFTMARVIGSLSSLPQPLPPSVYHCGDFLRQLAPELETIAARGLKVVVNAGAFDPAGLAKAVRSAIEERGLALQVAHLTGDDVLPQLRSLADEGRLVHLETGKGPGALLDRIVAANAYMGGWGIAAALGAGADIVICGRVSDASLVLGPAAWWHGWALDDWDRLAAAVAAGHIIECGAMATGGNFAGFAELPRDIRLGYPIAEIAADGEVVITKRAEEGGAVTVDTVTAQLLYEIQGPRYLNPDVILHIDSIHLSHDGPDRVRLSGIKGSPAPETTKIGCFYPNGWRFALWAFAIGLDVQAKIDWLELQMRSLVDTLALDDYRFEPCGQAAVDPQSEAAASVPIRLAAAAQDKAELGKFVEGYASFALGGIPGFHGDGGGGPEMRVDFWPGLASQEIVRQQVVMGDGRTFDAPHPPMRPYLTDPAAAPAARTPGRLASGETRRIPLGALVYARSGDKGANANLGIWCRDEASWEWVRDALDAETVARLLGLRQDIVVERHELPNVRGLLFVLRGYFGDSGSGNIGLDPIGKGIGEFLRARHVDVPVALIPA
ncbi:acyclic terpene utilization AtuA family protein [Flavisphingomonas formosensis]|uniref:acyclic terpene utilization AtuA family protein n=1 Tax=Flavisphingomonas formosensis TaxID=861534 RepID=UPI0012FC8BC2|nr:acyclic terpene utilization AtuA family protein [Sphingomonas formosensis]